MAVHALLLTLAQLAVPGHTRPATTESCTAQLLQEGCVPLYSRLFADASPCDFCIMQHIADLKAAGCTDVFLEKFCDTPLSSYPTFADMGGKPYSVSYDKRSLRIAGKPALFVSGAIHPPRGTPEMWQGWFDMARLNNLNMVQVYIFWNYHEPIEGKYDWSGRGNLTNFMQMARDSGIFVNLRIGPYVCAEWTYGGLPAWLGQKPGVAFRQTNAVWQPAMEKWFRTVVDQMAAGKFFATQGGPIVLVQVENELPKTDTEYVAWCGTMAQSALDSVGVKVPITMCNGETANNTINTCNGNDCTAYLEKHGQNGRILIDQPALWTENEGGFQTWGGAPPPGKEPYFWGRSVADQAMSVMKWFARGGSHMNCKFGLTVRASSDAVTETASTKAQLQPLTPAMAGWMGAQITCGRAAITTAAGLGMRSHICMPSTPSSVLTASRTSLNLAIRRQCTPPSPLSRPRWSLRPHSWTRVYLSVTEQGVS